MTGTKFLRTVVLVMLGSSPVGASAAQYNESSLLRGFLQTYLRDQSPAEDTSTRYSAASALLNGGSEYVFVYVTGRDWCGNGGCTALLLKPARDSFEVIEQFTLVRLPIRVLQSRTNGWHDLAMPVQGGGILQGHSAILQFDGSKYPKNPSLAPVLASKMTNSGTRLPLSESGELLYRP